LGGDYLSLSRLITHVESDGPQVQELMGRVFPLTGRARLIGVTGPPGAGKSTLVDAMTAGYRAAGLTVGILAFDPSSPFTGGAVLGDRLRMQRWATDPGVFIRSLATRGHLGGLSPAARGVARLLDAAGFDVVLIETVGAGQSEIEIMDLAHTVVLVLAPGAGDDIQAQKAGILEIADVLAVNKADLAGAAMLAGQLESVLDLAPSRPPWRPPVLQVVARENRGVDRVLDTCADHLSWLCAEGRLHARSVRRIEDEVAGLVGRIAAASLVKEAREAGRWGPLIQDVVQKRTEPRAAALLLWERLRPQHGGGTDIAPGDDGSCGEGSR